MSFLERITAARRADAESRVGSLDAAREAAGRAEPARDFTGALARPGMSLIAEVKRASPSAGPIAPGADAAAVARTYQEGGAAAVSVLTEPSFFDGALEDVGAVRGAVAVPVLRKDFICTALQVWEARAAGADAVLLIVAALPQGELEALHALAYEAGLAVLVETHDEDEVRRAADAGARIVGINTRDLATLEVDPKKVEALRALVPDGAITVGESGVKTRADVASMESLGVDAVLIGETLMRAADPAAAIRALLGRED